MKKIARIISAILLIILIIPFAASGESTNYNINAPYYSYTYNSEGKAVQMPSPYNAGKTVSGKELTGKDFSSLSDVFYDSETGKLFLTDSGANEIVVLNADYSLAAVIGSFDNQGTADSFNNPSSVCVRDGKMYVSDTGNGRILRFGVSDFSLQKVLTKPVISVLGDNYDYKPARLAVDLAGRLYVIATDINDGIILLDANGGFVRFVGAPDVKSNLWTKFLKSFMTKAQKANLEKAVPTEYNSIIMDKDGFLYLTSSDTTVHPITRINSQGKDILDYDNNDYPDGDCSYLLSESSKIISSFVDIAVNDHGKYAAMDTEKGRVFVYSREGVLLYCFGNIGTQNGTFYSPSSIEMFGDTIVVADRFYNTLTVFSRTEFGASVDDAAYSMLSGDYANAERLWREVLRLCPSYEAADTNLARVEIQNREYSAALKRLKGTSETGYYSKAFEGVRDSFVRKHFGLLLAVAIVLITLLVLSPYIIRKLRIKEKLDKYRLIKKIRYSNYTMFHPFDGFWDLKREQRGSLAAANVLSLLFIAAYTLRVQFSGYIFTGTQPREVNTLYEIAKIIIPLGLWCVSNWCFTSLMDGEGTLKDVYIATAYSLKPYIITAVPMWLLSLCLVGKEAFIYNILNGAVLLWMLVLIFLSMMMTHDYTLSRAIVVTVLTLVGICLILFIALTFTNIIQKVYDFFKDLYLEFIYRTY